MIYDLKRSVDLRWLFDPVLHSSLDDLVLFCFKRRSWNYFRLPAKVHDYLCAWSTLRAVICGHGNTKITVQVEATPPPGVWTFWIGQWTLFGTDANFADIYVCVCQTTRMVLLELIECSCVLRINSSLFIYTSSLKTVHIHCCRKENLDLCLYFVRYPGQLPCGSYSRILRSAQPLCFDWLLP